MCGLAMKVLHLPEWWTSELLFPMTRHTWLTRRGQDWKIINGQVCRVRVGQPQSSDAAIALVRLVKRDSKWGELGFGLSPILCVDKRNKHHP